MKILKLNLVQRLLIKLKITKDPRYNGKKINALLCDEVGQFNKKIIMTTLQYEDSGYREKQIQKEKDDFAIGFGLFLSGNMYENMYADLDKDGKTWISYFQEGFDDRMTANRFTIQELLEIYKNGK